jgi:hypothetical protein
MRGGPHGPPTRFSPDTQRPRFKRFGTAATLQIEETMGCDAHTE